MKTYQRVIKYFAIAFAALLIFSIFSSILFGLSKVSSFFGKEDYTYEELKELEVTCDIKNLDTDISYANLDIKVGSELKIETDNKYISAECKDGKLLVKENKHRWKYKSKTSSLIIYLPEDILLENVDIDAGAGEVKIESINSDNLNIDFGAGKATINNLVVNKSTRIDGGAGQINILNGSMNNLDLDIGVGEFNLKSKLTGENKIDAGVGEINIDLIGNSDDYKLNLDKGIGKLKLSGKNVKSGTYGEGSNVVNISGGIGNINIEFNN